MPIPITCSCGQSLRAPDSAAGKVLKCPTCSNPIKIPASAVQPGPANAGQGPQAKPAARPGTKSPANSPEYDPFSAGLPTGSDPFSVGPSSAQSTTSNPYWSPTTAPGNYSVGSQKSNKAKRKFPLWLIGVIGGVGSGIAILVIIIVVGCDLRNALVF
jgi:hypothetical protein